jgi:hypothetical protein
LFRGQALLDAITPTSNEAPTAVITWHTFAVGALLRLNGNPLDLAERQMEFAVVGRSETLVDAANLGMLRWPQRATVVETPRKESQEGLLHRALWLFSVSAPRGRAPASLAVPESLRRVPSFGLLCERSWDDIFRPQLRALQNDMDRAA